MAGRSQHPVQIMENQTRFNLNAAIENWRHELASQPNLASDDRRELETHLRDAIAGFQKRGLNDEESFWLARRRVGQPQQLGEEFVKADPAKVWRERILWIAVGTVGCYELTTGQDVLSNLLDPFGRHTGAWLYLGLFVVPCLTLVGLTLMVRYNRVSRPLNYFGSTIESPKFLASVLSVVLFLTILFAYFSAGRIGKSANDMFSIGAMIEMGQTWVFSAAWPAMMILIVFLMPRVPPQNRKTPKLA
jgi:hypothetical protein